MSVEPRRSSRANKGQHSFREAYNIEEELIPQKRSADVDHDDVPKRQRTNDDAAYIDKTRAQDADDDFDEEGDVRCQPCGTNKENYDEDNDQGGMMIECDGCKTWQHAKCMGYKNSKSIPKQYKCNVCQGKPISKSITLQKPVTKGKNESSDDKVVAVLKNPTRKSVVKAFKNVFFKNIDSSYTLPEGFDSEKLSGKWSFGLEAVIFEWAGNQSNKKYTDKSRSLMVSIKKPNVIKRLLDNDLSFNDIVNLSPEEIDSDLKKYADKVRQESIRRSVLTVDENQGQRIRRTHKGEELVEDTSNQQVDDLDANIMTRNIDHRRFLDDQVKESDYIVDSKSKNVNYSNVGYDDDDDDDIENEENDQNEDDYDPEDKKEKSPEAESKDTSNTSSISDDDLDLILRGKPTNAPAEEQKPKSKPQVHLPPSLPNHLWSGRFTFPGFASFSANAEFFTCSNYREPVDINSVIGHNRSVKTSKEIYAARSFTVQGKLSRSTAESYLQKIVATRDLFLVEVTCAENQYDYDKMYQYLAENGKVAVLSDKPPFVKDAYLIPIDGNDPHLNPVFSNLPKVMGKKGLFGLYVVKKDHSSVQPNTIKRTPPSGNATPVVNNKHHQPPPQQSLDSILTKLSGGKPNHLELQPQPTQSQVPTNGLPNNLTSDQLMYLSNLVKQNPHVQNNPQALVQLIQQLHNNLTPSSSNYNNNNDNDDDDLPTYE